MKTVQFIGITPEELKEAILLDFRKEIEILKKDFQPKQPNEYLTRKEVAEFFSIDISTVHNWTVKGILNSYGTSNRVYYLRSEIEAALIQLR